MTKYISLLALLFFSVSSAFSQTVNPAPDRANDPAIGYPNTDVLESEAMAEFDAEFPEQNVGFMHVYADPLVDPNEVYLMRGVPASGTVMALLPKKYQRMAERMNAEVYAAAAVRGIRENMYIVRMDGSTSDRLEMFAIRGNKVKHLKTLAYRACSNGSCQQTDSYITDIDGDTNLDLVTIKRTQTRNGDRAVKRSVYSLNESNRKWKKTKDLDTPWNSIEFFDPSTDNN
jgi:hypothetical protein